MIESKNLYLQKISNLEEQIIKENYNYVDGYQLTDIFLEGAKITNSEETVDANICGIITSIWNRLRDNPLFIQTHEEKLFHYLYESTLMGELITNDLFTEEYLRLLLKKSLDDKQNVEHDIDFLPTLKESAIFKSKILQELTDTIYEKVTSTENKHQK